MTGTKLEITTQGNKDLEILLDAFESGDLEHIATLKQLGIVQGSASLFGIGSKPVLKIEAELQEELSDETIEKLTEAMQLICGEATKLIVELK